MYTSNYYYDANSALGLALLQSMGAILIITVALLAFTIITEWKVFEKANEKGWYALIPFYSNYVQFRAFWGDTKYFWIYLLCSALCYVPVIKLVAWIPVLVIAVMLCYKKSKAFGEGVGFTIGLVLLPTIFDAIIAFSKEMKYVGVPEKTNKEKIIDSKLNDFVNENFSSSGVSQDTENDVAASEGENVHETVIDNIENGDSDESTEDISRNLSGEEIIKKDDVTPNDDVHVKVAVDEKGLVTSINNTKNNNSYFEYAVNHPEDDDKLSDDMREKIQSLRRIKNRNDDEKDGE